LKKELNKFFLLFLSIVLVIVFPMIGFAKNNSVEDIKELPKELPEKTPIIGYRDEAEVFGDMTQNEKDEFIEKLLEILSENMDKVSGFNQNELLKFIEEELETDKVLKLNHKVDLSKLSIGFADVKWRNISEVS